MKKRKIDIHREKDRESETLGIMRDRGKVSERKKEELRQQESEEAIKEVREARAKKRSKAK